MSKVSKAGSSQYLTDNNSYLAWTSQTLTPNNIKKFHRQVREFKTAAQLPIVRNPKTDFDLKRIPLHKTPLEGSHPMSLQDALGQRRSARAFQSTTVSLSQLSYLLENAVNAGEKHHRSTPSAGAFYSIQIYCVINSVEEIDPGIYLYDVESHTLLSIATFNDPQKQYELLGFYQTSIPAVTFIYTSIFEDVQKKYGERGWRFLHFEVGQLMQNFHLVATTQSLASRVDGGGLDYEIMSALDTHPSVEVYMCALHVGHEQPLDTNQGSSTQL